LIASNKILGKQLVLRKTIKLWDFYLTV